MSKRPEITISTTDAERLEALLASTPKAGFPGRAELQAELDRANVVAPHEVPPTVVTMNSTVRFEVEGSSDSFELTLVYPKDADASGLIDIKSMAGTMGPGGPGASKSAVDEILSVGGGGGLASPLAAPARHGGHPQGHGRQRHRVRLRAV